MAPTSCFCGNRALGIAYVYGFLTGVELQLRDPRPARLGRFTIWSWKRFAHPRTGNKEGAGKQEEPVERNGHNGYVEA